MLQWLPDDIDGHFWQPEELENMANPDFNNLKHLENLGHFYLTTGSMFKRFTFTL